MLLSDLTDDNDEPLKVLAVETFKARLDASRLASCEPIAAIDENLTRLIQQIGSLRPFAQPF